MVEAQIDDCEEKEADSSNDSVGHETVLHCYPDSFDVSCSVVRTDHRSHSGGESQLGKDEQVHDIVDE